jgi:hypothetical protein
MRSKFVFCPTCIIENYLTSHVWYGYGCGFLFIYYLFILVREWGFWTFCNKAEPEIDYSLPLAFFFPFIGNVYVAGT